LLLSAKNSELSFEIVIFISSFIKEINLVKKRSKSTFKKMIFKFNAEIFVIPKIVRKVMDMNNSFIYSVMNVKNFKIDFKT
jgi:hypothetical protein